MSISTAKAFKNSSSKDLAVIYSHNDYILLMSFSHLEKSQA